MYRNFVVFGLTLILCWTAVVCAAEAHFENPPGFNILMIYSGNRSNEACLSVAEGVQSALLNRAVAHCLEIFELNMLYENDPKRWDVLMESYMPDIHRKEYDLIVAESKEACAVLMKRLAEIPPQISVIFSNISQFDLDAARKLHPNTTAILRRYDASPNIRLGLKILPQTRKIILLTSSFDWKEEYRAEFQKILPDKTELQICFFDNDRPDTLSKIAKTLHDAGKNSFVVSMDWDRFFANRESRIDIWNWLKKNYEGPIFARRKVNLDFALGGEIQSLFSVGALTGEYAEKIAAGTGAKNLDPAEGKSELIFNVKEIDRLRIPRENLPDRYEEFNAPQSWILQDRNQILLLCFAFSFVILAMGAAMGVLLLKHRKWMRLGKVMEMLPARIAVFDRTGNILYFHIEPGMPSGIEPDVVYHHVSDLPMIKTRNLLDVISRVYDSGKPEVLDYDFYGERRSVIMDRIENSVFGPKAVISVSHDSSRLQWECAAAHADTKRMAMMLNFVNDAVFQLDVNGQIAMLNQRAEKLINATRDSVNGKTLDDVLVCVSPTTGEKPENILKTLLLVNDASNMTTNLIYLPSSEEPKHLTLSAMRLRDADGTPNGILVLVRDITGEWKEKEKQNTSLTLMEYAIKFTNISFFRMNLKTEEIVPLFGERLRFAPLLNGKSMPLKNWIIAEDITKLEMFLKNLNQSKITYFNEVFHSDYSGVRQYLSVQATVQRIGFGVDAHDELIGVCRDITMTIMEEERQRENRAMQEAVENAIPYPIVLKAPDDQFRYVHCNKAFAEIFGKAVQDVIGKTDYDLFAIGSDADAFRANDKTAIAGLGSTSTDEVYHTASGEKKSTRVIRNKINCQNGKSLLMAMVIDISHSVEEKSASREMLGFFSALLDQMPTNMYVKDADNEFRYLLWNRTLEEQTGFDKKKIIGTNNREQGMPPDIAAKYEFEDRKLMESGQMQYFRKNFRHKEKGEIICDVYRVPVLYGNHRYLLGMSLDVTNHIRTSEQFKSIDRQSELFNTILQTMQSEHDYKTAVGKMLEMIGMAWNADQGFVYRRGNGAFFREDGWTSDGIQSLDYYPDTEMPAVLKLFLDNQTLIIEDMLKLPVGLEDSMETLLAEKVKSLIFVPLFLNGVLYGQIGFMWRRDNHIISKADERFLREIGGLFLIAKEHERQREVIHEQSVLQSMIFDKVPVPLSLLDSESTLCAANAAFCDLFGIPRNGVLGKYCQELCPMNHSEYCEPDRCPILYVIEHGQFRTQPASFSGKTVQANAYPILNSTGAVQYVLQTYIDITKLSQEKQELKNFIEHNGIIHRCTEIMLLEPDLKRAFELMTESLSKYYPGFSIRIMRSHQKENGFSVEPFAVIVQPEYEENIRDHSFFQESQFPAIFTALRAGENLFSRLNAEPENDIPVWKEEMKKRQQELGFQDVMLFPIFCENTYWGYIDVDRGNADAPFTELDRIVFYNAKHVLEIVLKREQLQRKIQHQGELTAQIFDRISIPMLLLDSKQNIRVVNKSFCELFDRTPEQLLGNQCKGYVCEDSPEHHCNEKYCPIIQTICSGTGHEHECSLNDRKLHWKIQPLFGLDNKVEYVLSCAFDVTEEKKRQEQIAENMRQLEQLNEVKKRYLEQDRQIAECLEIVAFENDIDSAWEKILSKIGLMLETEGVALMQFLDTPPAHAVVRNIWNRNVSEHVEYINRQYPDENFHASNALLRQGKILHGYKPELRPEIPWENEFIHYCNAGKQCELVALPLRCGSKYWGHMAVMQSLTPPFSSEQMRLIEQFAHIIEVLLTREEYRQSGCNPEHEKQLILDTVASPLVLLDNDLNILYVNHAALGNDKLAKEWKQKTSACLYCSFHQECDPRNPRKECIITNARKLQKLQTDEVSDGNTHIIYHAVPIIRDGAVTRILLSSSDVTALRREQKNVMSDLKNAKSRISRESDFLAAFSSHLLRRISMIFGKLEHTDAWPSVEEEALLFSSTLHSVRQIAEMEHGVFAIHPVPADIVAILERIRQKYREKFEKHSLAFELIHGNELPPLLVDVERLEQIISFFVDKSLHFTHQGGVQISAEYAMVDKRLRIGIRDTGIGIEPDIISFLIDPDKSEKWEGDINNDRLELILFAKMIRLGGGTIDLQSAPGRGTCFTIGIPAEKAILQTAAKPLSETSAPADEKLILVVDDVMVNLRVLAGMLKKQGCQVCVASSGQEALDKLKDITPSCILTDIWMPEMNGVELAGHIRKNHICDNVPIVAVTADAESERTFDMSVFTAIVIKPVTIPKLQQVLVGLNRGKK